MLGWKRKKNASEAEGVSVGITVGEDDVLFVALDGQVDGQPNVLAWESVPYSSLAEVQSRLGRFVQDFGLEGRPCRCALNASDYSLRLVERPANVPDDELVDATRWLIRDLIEFDIETSALAILTIPGDGARARTPHMFVIAAKQEPTHDMGNVIASAGLRLAGFEIPESAMLALDAGMPEIVAGGAVLRLTEKASVLTVSHDHHLFLSRNLNTDLESIDRAADQALTEEDPAGPAIIECLDPLLLDVQRSFDYYESEYGKAPASRLTLLPGTFDMTPLLPALSEALRPVQVEAYDINRFFAFPEPPPAEYHQALSLAIGSAIAPPDLIGDALLPGIFRKNESGFGLSSVARLAAGLTLVLGAYYGYATYQLDHKSEILAEAESRREALSASIEAGLEKARLEAEAHDPEAEIADLTSRRDAHISMLRDMTQRATQRQASFSSLLAGLARQDARGIWLERIAFENGGAAITLEGRTLEANRLPTYLRALGTEPSFSERTFQRFEVERTDSSQPGLVFRLATEGERQDSAEARR